MSNISEINGQLINAESASFAATASLAPNYVLNSATSSFTTNTQTGSFATTGSNVFKASQTITGSLTITNDLIVLGSASITNISQSTLNIGTNLITVNTNTPSVRFGGLAVIDSGSSPQRSGSILFDSTNDQWIFIHQNVGGNITSSIFIQGPQTFNNVGNETNLTTNRIPKSVNAEHIGDSNISDNGTVVSINSNTQITGSLITTAGITGNLTGTSSWATNALTASSVSTLNQNVLITGSLTVGATSLGSNENTLVVGPAPAGGTGEGGQILLQAPGGIYTSASMFDNYQNLTRILRGTNASSDAVVAQWNMHSKQVSFPAYNSTTAFNNTTLVGLIGFDSNGNLLTTNTGSSGGGGGGGTSLGLTYAVSLGYILP